MSIKNNSLRIRKQLYKSLRKKFVIPKLLFFFHLTDMKELIGFMNQKIKIKNNKKIGHVIRKAKKKKTQNLRRREKKKTN